MIFDIDYHLPVNIGSEDEHTILDIAETIRDMINPKLEFIHVDLPVSDPKQRRPDITLAKKLLNWEPKYSLEFGLEKTIEYFKSVLFI